MRTLNHTLCLLGASLALASCNPTDGIGPVNHDEVVITLSVSGGIAGVQFGVVIDGTAGEARLSKGGLTEAVLPLSRTQISDLALRLDEAGVIAMGDQDFGNSCCDMFSMGLTYQSGEHSVHLQGTQNLWPTELTTVLDLLSALGSGRVPLLVFPGTDEDDWPQDALSIGDVTADGWSLSVRVTYGGGCGQHRMDLVVWGGWLESFPVQANGVLTHDDGDDACDALISEERVFDLRPLRDAYVDAYGPIGPDRPTVVLRLRDPESNGAVLVEIAL